MPSSSTDYAALDLQAAVASGLDRGGHLLTEGERVVAERVLGLIGDPAVVYARLISRKPEAFPLDELSVPGVEDVVAALDGLEGLVDRLVPAPLRARLATRSRLAEGCRRAGLPVGGRREELAARLAGLSAWDRGPWVRPRHRPLMRRLQRWAALSAWPAEHEAVLERMGALRFAEYPLSTGPALHRDRAELLAWEAAWRGLDDGTLSEASALSSLALRAPAGLDLRAAIRHSLEERARALERVDPLAALALYQRMMDAGVRPASLAFRRARCAEALGRGAEALSLLVAARSDAVDEERRALERAGRRLARTLGAGFPPESPLRPARERTIWLDRAPTDGLRPLWQTVDGPATVEDAVVAHVAARGRDAAHVEGRIWRSLSALCLADAYFLPVPGALPVRRLTGPLDLRTHRFRADRPLVDETLTALRRGDGVALLRRAWPRWSGVRLRGLDPDLPFELLESVAAAVPGPALAAIVERLLTGRSSGMPDLVVLPGPEVVLDAHPSRLGPGLLLVEVKGPTDELFDRQRLWHDVLLGWGLAVERWDARERPLRAR